MDENRTNRQEVEELYADDPDVTPAEYVRFMHEADEMDEAATRNTELADRWAARDDQEEGEPA